MRTFSLPLVSLAGLALLTGCGSSNGSSTDTAPDQRRVFDTPVVPDGPSPADAADGSPPPLDVAWFREVGPDKAGSDDGAVPPLDGGTPGRDVAAGETGGSTGEAGGSRIEAGGGESGASKLDGGGSDGDVPGDAAKDVAADGFVPGPAVPVVVNSSNTATYNLADGTWKVFYFDATAGQLYCISELDGIVRGYVSTSAAVSPSNYQYVTHATDGTLAFTASAAQRYYIAVAASGGGVSGSFQVADGGQLLALGANSVSLSAPNSDNYHFFRFPIVAGHSYNVAVTGAATTSLGLGLSPQAERASNGQFSIFLRGVSGPLPFNEAIPNTSVALSYSGYYFLFLRVYTAMTATVTITQTS